MKYDPALSHFDLDRARGIQGELFVDDVRDALATKNGRIEVKTDAYFFSASAMRFGKQQRLYVERECLRSGEWQPSGIETTRSEIFAFKFGKHAAFIAFATEWVRRAVALAERDARNAGSCDYGKNPTRGTYVYMTHFLLTREIDKDEH